MEQTSGPAFARVAVFIQAVFNEVVVIERDEYMVIIDV